ncbi:MAG: hypothetical protein QXP55_01760 [Nitrososphaerales archaeon]
MVKNPRCPNCIIKNRKGKSEGHVILRKDGTCPKCGKKYTIKPINKGDNSKFPHTIENTASSSSKPMSPVQSGVAPIYGFPRNDNEVAKIGSENNTSINDENSDKRALKFLIIALIVVLLMMGINALSLLGGSLIFLLVGIFGWTYLIFKT